MSLKIADVIQAAKVIQGIPRHGARPPVLCGRSNPLQAYMAGRVSPRECLAVPTEQQPMIIRACKVLASAIEAWKLPTNQFPRIATLAVNFPQQIDPQFHKALDSEVERILGVACQRELFSPAEAPNVAHDQHSETAGPGNQAGGAKGEGTKVEIRRAQIPALRSQSQHAKQESFVAELTKRFDVSRATIMGDLKALRREGKIPTTSKSAKTLTNHMHILNPTRGERV